MSGSPLEDEADAPIVVLESRHPIGRFCIGFLGTVEISLVWRELATMASSDDVSFPGRIMAVNSSL